MTYAREKIEVDVVVCDWCGKTREDKDDNGMFSVPPSCDEFGDEFGKAIHLCDPECLSKAAEFATHCRQADVCSVDGEIQLANCRECGEKFSSSRPHRADGLCYHCSPLGACCRTCHTPLSSDPRGRGGLELNECEKCAVAAFST